MVVVNHFTIVYLHLVTCANYSIVTIRTLLIKDAAINAIENFIHLTIVIIIIISFVERYYYQFNIVIAFAFASVSRQYWQN